MEHATAAEIATNYAHMISEITLADFEIQLANATSEECKAILRGVIKEIRGNIEQSKLNQ